MPIHRAKEKKRCHHFMGYYFQLAARHLLYALSPVFESTDISKTDQQLLDTVKGTHIDTYYEALKAKISFQPVLYGWCNKGYGMCYPFCGIVHAKKPCC